MSSIVKIDRETNTKMSWFIWYTKPRAEKKVMERLISKGIDTFLPLRKELRQWSDRKKWVESPLFNGYIFTNIAEKELNKVLYTEGILNFVRCEGKPAMLKSEQIDEIKLILSNFTSFVIEDNIFQPGEYIEIIEGPLSGLHGKVVSFRGNKRLAVVVEQLGKVLLIELPKKFVDRKEIA